MREIEAIDSWLCARLGKSREHASRVAACIQMLELAFDLLEKYRVQYDGFGSGLADDQFHQRMLIIASEFLKREPMTNHDDRIKMDPVAIEIHNDVVRGAINYVQIIIRQYYLLFIDLDGTMYVYLFYFPCSYDIIYMSFQVLITVRVCVHVVM